MKWLKRSLTAVAKAVEQMNLNVITLTETKITNDIYTKFTSNYHMHKTKAISLHHGGVAWLF